MLEKNYHIALKQIKILASAIAVTLFIIILLTGCDLCPSSTGPGNDKEQKIYFTSLTVNNDLPNLFSVNKELDDIKLIHSGAMIFSSPSKNNKLALLTKSNNNVNVLSLYDISNKKETEIIRDNQSFSVNYPVISPDGSILLFNGIYNDGSIGLISYYEQSSGMSRFSYILSGTYSSFSYDGNYIACFTGEQDNFSIAVYSAHPSTQQIFTKNFAGYKLNLMNENTIKWNLSENIFSITYSDDITDYLYINDLSNNEKIIPFSKNDLGLIEASISPDGNFVAFISIDGSLWLRSLSETDIRYSKIIDGNTMSCFNPKWSSDGNSLFFLNQGSEFNQFNSQYDMYMVKLKYNGNLVENVNKYLISGNVVRAYWSLN